MSSGIAESIGCRGVGASSKTFQVLNRKRKQLEGAKSARDLSIMETNPSSRNEPWKKKKGKLNKSLAPTEEAILSTVGATQTQRRVYSRGNWKWGLPVGGIERAATFVLKPAIRSAQW